MDSSKPAKGADAQAGCVVARSLKREQVAFWGDTPIAPISEIGTPEGGARCVVHVRWPSGGGVVAVQPCAPATRAACEDVRVVQQPIEQGGDGGGIAEELAPILDGAVRGEEVEARS